MDGRPYTEYLRVVNEMITDENDVIIATPYHESDFIYHADNVGFPVSVTMMNNKQNRGNDDFRR